MIGRRTVAVGVTLAAVVGGGIVGAVVGVPGLSGASTTSTTPKTPASPKTPAGPSLPGGPGFGRFGDRIGGRGDLIGAAASALKLSTADLLKKLSDGKTTIADVAEQQGVKLKDVIGAMQKVANDDISNIVNNPFPAPELRGPFPGGAPKGPMGGPGPSFGMGFGFGELRTSFSDVAKALGISPQDLMTDLRNGQSIADIAKSKHVDVDGLIATLVNDVKAQLKDAVSSGKLKQDQATKIESMLEKGITMFVKGGFPKGGPHFGFRGRGGRGGPGPLGAVPAPSAAPSSSSL